MCACLESAQIKICLKCMPRNFHMNRDLYQASYKFLHSLNVVALASTIIRICAGYVHTYVYKPVTMQKPAMFTPGSN